MVSNVSVTVDSDNQIVICVGDECRRGDTYYLGIADTAGEGVRIHDQIAELVRTWIRCLESLPDFGVTWLPFDFSDEYTRWLGCRREGATVRLEFGWSAVEGWAIRPFDASEYQSAAATFRADSTAAGEHVLYRPFLLSRLRSCLTQLGD